MKQLRKRLTFANVLSVIALFIALGGAAYAAGKINGKQIKPNSIPGNRIKKQSLTGTQINLAKLGKVPSASLADSATNATNAANATNATNAGNANTVNEVTSFTYAENNGNTNTTVLNDFHGLTLSASCESGDNNGLTVKAASAVGGAAIGYDSVSQGGTGGSATGTVHNDSYENMPASTPLLIYSPNTNEVSTTNGSVGIGFATGEIVYSQPDGSQVSVNWLYDTGVEGHDCYWSGTVVGTP